MASTSQLAGPPRPSVALSPTAPTFSPSSSAAGPSTRSLLTSDASKGGSRQAKRLSPTPPKPVLCAFFRSPAGCPQDQDCRFVHETPGSVGPLEPGKHQRLKRERAAAEQAAKERDAAVRTLDKRALMPCKFWVQGFCHRSSACVYAHALVAPSLDDVLGASAAGAAVSGEVTAAAGKDVPGGACEEDEAEACSVCYDVPEFYGLLESCNHIFCLSCIHNWRSQTEGDSRAAAKTCPSCRTRSAFVTPSSRFFAAGDEKTAVVDRYKASMGKKECKYFAASLRSHPSRPPSCPFRDSCFYSHARPFPTGPKLVFGSPVGSLLSARRRPAAEPSFGHRPLTTAATLTSVLLGIPPYTGASRDENIQAVTTAHMLLDEARLLDADRSGPLEAHETRRQMARAIREAAVGVLGDRLEAVNGALAGLPDLENGGE